jgi:sortase A
VHDIGVARARTRPGQALANLQIPIIGLNLVIGEGDNASQLRAGPGHRIGTPIPGTLGNSLVFGHRHGWGGPLASLGKLKVGDEIFVQARLGQPTLFAVTSVKVVSQGDTRLLDPSTDYRLTLVTGTGGGFFSTRRLIVTAVSGSAGHLRTPVRSVPATAPRGSLIFNRTIGALLLLALGAAAAARGLRGRYRPLTAAIVVSPLVASALLALLLELDLLLPPLH